MRKWKLAEQLIASVTYRDTNRHLELFRDKLVHLVDSLQSRVGKVCQDRILHRLCESLLTFLKFSLKWYVLRTLTAFDFLKL